MNLFSSKSVYLKNILIRCQTSNSLTLCSKQGMSARGGPFLWWDFGLGILHLARACGRSTPANLRKLHVIRKALLSQFGPPDFKYRRQ